MKVLQITSFKKKNPVINKSDTNYRFVLKYQAIFLLSR